MKPRVWMVDDLKRNRDKFQESHEHRFTVRVFKSPYDVLTALESERPDALLSDIYFYDDPLEAERVERSVEEKAKELLQFAKQMNAEGNETGIKLISDIRTKYKDDPPFPIYAYTAKGPYLLHSQGFEQLVRLDTRWLFKNKYNAESEALIIKRGIEKFKELRSSRYKHAVSFLLGAVVTWGGERLLDWGFHYLKTLFGS